MKVFFSFLAWALFAPLVHAGHPLDVTDMQRLSRIGGARLSPDGKRVVFTVGRPDLAKNAMVTNLWIVPTAGGAPHQITFEAKGSNSQPQWAPDSETVYFLSNRSGETQVYRLSLGGGESKPITSLPTGVDAFYLSPDSKTLALVSSVFPECADAACNEKKAKDDNPVKVRVITDIPFRRWDSWVDGRRNHIFVLPADGGDAKDLTPGDVDSPIWTEEGSDEVAFSPDSKELCFSRFTENEALTGNSDLFTMPATGGAARAITTNKGRDQTPLYSPDGHYIAYSATLRLNEETDQVRLFLYDRFSGTVKNLFEQVDRSISSYAWSPDSKSLFITFEDHGEVPLARLDLATLKLTKLVTGGTTDNVQPAASGDFLVFTLTDFAHPSEIFRLNLSLIASAEKTSLTHLNADVLKDVDFGTFSSFTFPGWNGEEVQAWRILPPHFDGQKKYPLLLLMHGGPENAWDNLFHYRWNAQAFAAAGYVVIAPNFHGSSGFGLRFMDTIKGQWGGAPYEDQMKAVDVAMKEPYVDQTRLLAAGASYGGYMANWVEGHTDRFRTIVSHDGLYDLVTMFYSGDLIGGTYQEFKGAPWDNIQALVDQAPVTYAKNFKTPMLIVHGEKDYRVDPSQGFAMFQVLQAMHVPSKLVYFKEENHWVLKPADSVFWYRTVLEWLEKWAKPDAEGYRRMLGR